jgi:hypothetical protein
VSSLWLPEVSRKEQAWVQIPAVAPQSVTCTRLTASTARVQTPPPSQMRPSTMHLADR